MRSDPAWQAARALPKTHKQERKTAFSAELQKPEDGHQGFLVWKNDSLPALIDWNDPVVKHGLDQRIKYARLIRRKATSERAEGADSQGYHYAVQLALEGVPYHKPKHTVGKDTVGLDLGPSTIAIVPQAGEARLEVLCAELQPATQSIRRLQRKMDRQRRAANPDNYDAQGRPKKRGKHGLRWRSSRGYEQKQFGTSVGLRAPGMFIEQLKRTVASTGGTLWEVSTRRTKLSQFCHGCGQTVKKPLSQRWHHCPCGVGPVQRDLYSAFLAAYLPTADSSPSCAQYRGYWEGAGGRGGAPAGSTRASFPTCQSASAQKSEHPETRANRPAFDEGDWKRGECARNPRCFSTRGAFSLRSYLSHSLPAKRADA
jgi:transposase